jgi:endonuclease/exonuclease/phosphatase family metal-dependent hydrolase
VRVMTWNLWWRFGPWEQRQQAIIETIRAVDPDVVCLQEVWSDTDGDLASVIGHALGYHTVVGSSIGLGDVGFSNAVMSRWTTDALADEALPGRDGSPGHRRIVAAVVETPWGAWPVASTHFDHRFDDSALRVTHARRMLELAAEWRDDPQTDLPLVVGGDLNAVPDSDEIRMLTGRSSGIAGVVFSDAWEQVGDGLGWTWRRENPYLVDSAWPNRRLDYVMVSWPRPKPTGNPISARLAATEPIEIDGTPVWASDHAAVVVELATPI